MRNIFATTVAVLVVALAGCDKGHDWNEVPLDHPAIEAARQEARDTYPEFLAALKKRRPMDVANVEVFYEGTEYITLTVHKASETEITGAVENYPQKVNLKRGEIVTIPLDDMSILSEWVIYKEDGEMLGGAVTNEMVRLRGSE